MTRNPREAEAMRRLIITVLLLTAGAGLLLTSVLAPAASAAPAQTGAVTVANPGNQAGVTGTAITPLQLHATDTDMVTTFVWTAGCLPPGLAVNSATGLISGTPTAAGTYSVTVTAVENTASPAASPSAAVTTPAATPTAAVTTPGATATATKPVTASAYMTPYGQVIFDWVITGKAGVATCTTPAAFPSGGVVTGGGGSLGSGANPVLITASAVLILAGAGSGLLWRRRSRKARLS